jgi:hypothetical protein
MTFMTDQTRVNALIQALFSSTTAFTITPGTSGGSAFTVTPPFNLRLMTTQGSNTSNGVEATASNCPGYVAKGNTLGTQFNGAPAGGTQTNVNAVTWSATSGWATITAIEIWDTAATTQLRWLQGQLTSAITGVANGDTVQFAVGSITTNASQW